MFRRKRVQTVRPANLYGISLGPNIGDGPEGVVIEFLGETYFNVLIKNENAQALADALQNAVTHGRATELDFSSVPPDRKGSQ